MRPHFSSPVTASPPAEPQAEQRPLERTLHDLRLIDEYAWLKAENWREVISDPFQLDPAICLEEAKAPIRDRPGGQAGVLRRCCLNWTPERGVGVRTFTGRRPGS